MKLKNIALKHSPHYLHESLAELFSRERRERRKEYDRIKKMGRYSPGSSQLLKNNVIFPDGASYISMVDEIFIKHIYKFTSSNNHPRIIDCGANIGLSTIYFKSLFSGAKITAFEADLEIAAYLKANLKSQNIVDIEVIEKAVWTETSKIYFNSDGADGGKIEAKGVSNNQIELEAVRLKDFLHEPIDLLKIDIEGAEVDVLIDCKEKLDTVDHLFVEYHSMENEHQRLPLILDVLSSAGFRYHIHQIGVTSPQPFVSQSIQSGMDLQLNIFAYRR